MTPLSYQCIGTRPPYSLALIRSLMAQLYLGCEPGRGVLPWETEVILLVLGLGACCIDTFIIPW